MKKGLKSTLLAAAAVVAGISSSYAAAPVISSLPDVQIGDAEGNVTTDNNIFIYTNAFVFDEHVSDADSTVSELLWSFDEGDVAGTETTDTQNLDAWFEINGIGATHVGLIASNASGAEDDHLNPVHELRATTSSANFRNIELSPTPAQLSYPDPTPQEVIDHGAGKFVTFYVSDSTLMTSATILVTTVDNASDLTSGGVTWHVEEGFVSTGPRQANGWVPTGGDQATHSVQFNATHNSLQVTVLASTTVQRTIGWVELNGGGGGDNGYNHLTYDEVGAGNWIRAKFNIYATNASGGVPADPNTIPHFRVRITDRFAYSNVLDISHHPVSDPGVLDIAAELTPSTSPAAPTSYRVDLVPPALPYYTVDGTESFQRMFESYATTADPTQAGIIALKESSIGTYGGLNMGSTPIKSYDQTADFVNTRMTWDLTNIARGPNLTATGQTSYSGVTNTTTNPIGGGSSGISITPNPGGNPGITLSTTGVPDTQIGIAAQNWFLGASEDGGINDAQGTRARVAEGKQYVVRFHATAAGDSSNNALLRFRARAVQFRYTQRLEVGGAWSRGSGRDVAFINQPANALARQYLPGAGGWTLPYDVPMFSPIHTDLGAQPLLRAQAGPGDNTVAANSRRDIFPAVDIIDSLSSLTGQSYTTASTSDPLEKGNVTVSKIEIFEFDQVED